MNEITLFYVNLLSFFVLISNLGSKRNVRLVETTVWCQVYPPCYLKLFKFKQIRNQRTFNLNFNQKKTKQTRLKDRQISR